MTTLVLSLFPGIGLLDMAFEQAGFCVVRGPDVLWGGDVRRFHPPAGKFDGVIGGPPCQMFSSLAHLIRANGHEPKFGNLIPEFERCVAESQVKWFLMEEVRAAPVPVVEGYGVCSFLWNNAWIAADDGFGQEQERLRRFSFGIHGGVPVDLRRWLQPAALMLMERGGTTIQKPVDNSAEAKGRVRSAPVTAMHDHPMFGDGRPTRREHRHPSVISSDGAGKVQQCRYRLPDACRLQGLPENFLEHAPFTKDGKLKAVANGVPIPMGRAIARAVKKAIGEA